MGNLCDLCSFCKIENSPEVFSNGNEKATSTFIIECTKTLTGMVFVQSKQEE